MELNKIAIAGSLESSDAMITLRPHDNGINLEIDSIVEKQFKDRIEAIAYEVLDKYSIEDVNIHIQDRGALDCVLEARIETAIKRGGTE